MGVPWADWFGWPGGQIWPNVLASGVCLAVGLPLTLWRHRKRLARQFAARVSEELAEHHVRVSEHITAELQSWLGPTDGEAP
jgi:hypothetical protein